MHRTSHFPKIFLFSCFTCLITASFTGNTAAAQLADVEHCSISKKQKLISVFPEMQTTGAKVKKSQHSKKLALNLKKTTPSETSSTIVTSADKQTAENTIQEASFDQPVTMPFEINDLHQYLNERIVGQNEAMLSLAVSIHTHYLRVKINNKISKFKKESALHNYTPIKKNNILLIGQEGCGKTECVAYIHDFLKQYKDDPDFDFPFVTYDNASENPDNFIQEIILSSLVLSKGNAQRAKNAVVFIDNFDQQLFSRDAEKEKNASYQTQRTWVPVLKGTDVTLEIPNGQNEENKGVSFKINTHNMLFIAAGRFKTTTHANLQSYDDSDLEEYGFTSELTDVFQSRVLFNQFNTRMLTQIISKPNTPFMNQAMTLLQEGYGITLNFSPEALQGLCEIAIKGGRCVQALQTTVDRLVASILKRAPTLRGQTVTISKADTDKLPRIKSNRQKFDEKFPGYVS